MLDLFLSLLSDPAEKTGFAKLYEEYRNDMYKAALGILKSNADAEDAVSQAFMNIIDKPHIIKSGVCPKTHAYLIVAAKNEAKKILKKRKKIVKTDPDTECIPDTFSIDDLINASVTAKQLEQLLLALPYRYYEILNLCVYMGLDISEAAKLIGITYENAKKRLQRARKKLKELLQEESDEQ